MVSEARQILADFIQRELDEWAATGKAKSEREWAKKAGKDPLPPHDIRRARKAQTGMSLDKLSAFAEALEVYPWQLLFPGFTRGSQGHPTWSAEAISVAQEIDRIEDTERRQKLAAGVIDVLRAGAPPASPTATTSEPPRPSPDSMRGPARHR